MFSGKSSAVGFVSAVGTVVAERGHGLLATAAGPRQSAAAGTSTPAASTLFAHVAAKSVLNA